MFVHNFHISMAQVSLDQSNTSYRVLKNIKSRFFRSSLAELRCVLHRQTLIWGVFWFLGVWECSGMLKTWFQKINLAVVILVIFPQSIFFWSKSRPQRSRFWGSGGISVVSPVRVERVLIRELWVGMLKMFFYQSSLRSDWTLTLRIRVERGGTGRARRFAHRLLFEIFEIDGQGCISNWCILFQEEEISVCAKFQPHPLRSVRDLENSCFFIVLHYI